MDLGALSFAEQIKTVHDAAVLAGISGSDLINGIFLPSQGAVVEIDPANRGAQVPNDCCWCTLLWLNVNRIIESALQDGQAAAVHPSSVYSSIASLIDACKQDLKDLERSAWHTAAEVIVLTRAAKRSLLTG